ncbi:MAG: ester cyclase [Microbacterium sp.]|uniref:ester cyclase n=1 Tax=Microbacterium sp. TaxID=51671 RepID=UPI003D6F3E2C
MGSAEEHKATARRALERVCTGGEPDDASRCYREDFVDHVNGLEFSGLEGVEESVSLYRQMFPRLEIAVEDQIAEGDRVATRWTMRGATAEGHEVELPGITISRFEDGRIEEDWTHFDSAELTRQLEATSA